MWEKQRMIRYEIEDMNLDSGAARREAEIMAAMRRKTMAKARDWD